MKIQLEIKTTADKGKTTVGVKDEAADVTTKAALAFFEVKEMMQDVGEPELGADKPAIEANMAAVDYKSTADKASKLPQKLKYILNAIEANIEALKAPALEIEIPAD